MQSRASARRCGRTSPNRRRCSEARGHVKPLPDPPFRDGSRPRGCACGGLNRAKRRSMLDTRRMRTPRGRRRSRTRRRLHFPTFMLGHWERYGFGFLVIDVADAAGKYVPIGHAGSSTSTRGRITGRKIMTRSNLGTQSSPAREAGVTSPSGPSSVDRGVRGVRSAAHFREVQSRQSEIGRRAFTLWYARARRNGKSAVVRDRAPGVVGRQPFRAGSDFRSSLLPYQ